MPRPPPHRPLARVLESDAQLAEWTARQRHEAALTRLVRRHLPRPLAERVSVTAAREHVLELGAGGGAVAAAVRQRLPDLRAALAREGADFAEIRVRVQVVATRPGPAQAPRRAWDSRAAAPIFDLADRLSPGPLKDALGRWSRRARGR
ncbi:MAG: hypothetical protein ACM3JC_00470 [Rudaea sp.]